ncbi:MAG: hypothetical protein ACYTHJ_17280 [Planctomycetota bacterium]|jgi:hypothetical protein
MIEQPEPTNAGKRDRLWLGACCLSLLTYLACSDAIRAFMTEAQRLAGKFLG